MKISAKKPIMFFGGMVVVMIAMIIISSSPVLDAIFASPNLTMQSFDFSKHNMLVFEDAYRGSNPDSPIVFALFSDFRCPACSAQYVYIKSLMQSHPDVNFLFKHTVKSSDSLSVFSAKAFECAKLQGAGYSLADYMHSGEFTESSVIQHALQIDIDVSSLLECINSSLIDTLILSDAGHASFLEVRGTPTIFLNGIKIEGVHTFEIYDELIKKEKKSLIQEAD
jgi:hypothetical protein